MTMVDRKEQEAARASALLKRSRIPVVSLIVDVIYGTLPAPFFVFRGEVAPNLMMQNVPGFLLFLVGLGVALGTFVAAFKVGGEVFITAAAIPILVHWILFFGHGLPNKTEKLFDLAGQVGVFFMVVYSYNVVREKIQPRHVIVIVLTLGWSLRLGYFLFTRFLERKKDFRFVAARTRYGYSFFTWTMQGVWVFIQGLSMLALLLLNNDVKQQQLNRVDTLGWVLVVLGVVLESVADIQKISFLRRYPNSATRPFITDGLWSLSRHPNYFGESLVWLGMFAATVQGFSDEHQLLLGIVATAFSPLFLMQTSLPWLEHLSDMKHGNDDKYWVYKLSTSAYIPLPRRPTFL